MRKGNVIIGSSLAGVLVFAGVLAIPPWNHRELQRLHTIIEHHFDHALYRIPDDLTGSFTWWFSDPWTFTGDYVKGSFLNGERHGTWRRCWGEERPKEDEFEYRLGKRHGIWRTYAPDGKLTNECEYRSGLPWNGICQIREYKGFTAYYIDGERIWDYGPFVEKDKR